MYSDDESDTSSEESSGISSIDSQSSSDSEKSNEEEIDDEIVAIRKIKMVLEDFLTKSGPISRRLNLVGDDDGVRNLIDTAVGTIKNFDRVENYNIELVALGACYDMLYKGIINDKNITEFVTLKISEHAYDPIDLIRYVTFYISKK